MITEETKKESPKKVTVIICAIIVVFTLWNMLNTFIDYKVGVVTFENMKKYHEEELERIQKIIEVLKIIRGEDINASK